MNNFKGKEKELQLIVPTFFSLALCEVSPGGLLINSLQRCLHHLAIADDTAQRGEGHLTMATQGIQECECPLGLSKHPKPMFSTTHDIQGCHLYNFTSKIGPGAFKQPDTG